MAKNEGKRKLDLDKNECEEQKMAKMSFTCKKCPLTARVTCKDDMRRHYIEAHGDKPVDCDVCQKLFPSANQMKDHKKAKHSFPCQHCERILAKPKDLEQHLNSSHGEQNKFKCELCPEFAFDMEKNLKKHIQEIHMASANIRKCQICPYAASSDEDLANHSTTHVPQTCKECGQNFPTGGQYYKHRKATGHDRWNKKDKQDKGPKKGK